ncbi:T9SS type A sorting domain-containing protein [Taibaiella koreensis]|uniref:T9SS type A sorting domain-containing protein n=1 Tax=Taibaiella koreensis TaxID=1268548 RepID=UPI000E59FF0A|nr:T9SS type A sorting domain-containing protein [Taibaiella koreensis]
MKRYVWKVILTLLLGSALPAFAQVDIKAYQQGNFVSIDTMRVIVDANDNSGVGSTSITAFFNIYNLSATHGEAFYLEAEWLCSNSSAFYQFCQQYPSDYTTGTCHTFHREGKRVYDDYNYTIPPSTYSYNYLQCHFFILDYSIEQEHEKVCRFLVKRRNTHEVLDSMYLIIRRGNLPCNLSQPEQPTGIHTLPADGLAAIYPNPASSMLTITVQQDQLTGCSLYTSDGKVVWDKQVTHEKELNLNVGSVSNGIYYLRLTDKQGRSFYKKVAVAH